MLNCQFPESTALCAACAALELPPPQEERGSTAASNKNRRLFTFHPEDNCGPDTLMPGFFVNLCIMSKVLET